MTAIMVSRILIFFALLVIWPVQAFANELEGAWALRIGEANIFVFEIDRSDTSEWSADWTRPESFASNGVVFAQLQGTERIAAMAAREFADFVELSFDDPRPGAVPDIFRIRVTGENQAELIYVGTQFAPYPLVRVAPGTALGPFDDAMIYDRDNAVAQAEYVDVGSTDADMTAPAIEENGTQSADLVEAEQLDDEESSRISADFLDDLD